MTDTTQTPTADQPAPATGTPAAATTPAPENPYAAPRREQAAGQPTVAPSNGFSIASLVLGLVSIPTGWFIAGIVAIVFGFLARSREPQARTMANWGIVLGFVGTFGWLLVALLGLLLAAPFALWGMSFSLGNGFLGLF